MTITNGISFVYYLISPINNNVSIVYNDALLNSLLSEYYSFLLLIYIVIVLLSISAHS